ncbi:MULTISPECIES: acyl-CoA dehydrogenase family protein [unclassified Streptomyces]|uniref:acyl-CoA dehydrogenase family protein n=1 Tax=unclassified Streptomyces TaxID=2593676 RepID=UPI00110FA748|nr:acyl-CoA dehydrogenase family protein [Streptomyces sp. DASNCL29]TMU98171.1 acyl-CoA dehydrogenase [Streptomyces sp. DASNCL29]
MSTTTEQGTAFRTEVRAWLAGAPWPQGLRNYGGTPEASDVPAGRQWQRTLADAGYACLHWPVEHGGRGASVLEQAIFAEETARAGVPRQLNIVGPDLAGPVIMRFGTEAQHRKYLPGILRGHHLWCQLFSEPEAGSDLASLRTRARQDGDGWTVDGQKVWTSAAGAADYGLLVARTGEERYQGITAFIVDMSLPGITVRPLRQLDGESKFNEVFFESVRLPAEAVLGEVGQGWQVATATLGQERLSLGAQAVGMFEALREVADAARERDLLGPVLEDTITSLWMRIWLLRATWLRALSEDTELSSPAFSVLKLVSSEVHRDLGDLATAALGADAMVDADDSPLVRRMLVGRAQTILGGTSEIQRNILAERVLGLPREPTR